jgi:hypothetical protein
MFTTWLSHLFFIVLLSMNLSVTHVYMTLQGQPEVQVEALCKYYFIAKFHYHAVKC